MIVAIIQARMNSSRLPGKVLLPVGKTNLLSLQLKRIAAAETIDKIILATTINEADSEIVNVANKMGVMHYRGSEDDVLDRFYEASKLVSSPDYIVRLTADCPLMDAALIDAVVHKAMEYDYDYYSNTLSPSFPDGLDIEVIKYKAFVEAYKKAVLPSEREHVTPYIWKNSSYMGGTMFSSGCYLSGDKQYADVRLTVDEAKDYEVIRHLVSVLGEDAGWKDYADHLLNNEDVRFNSSYQRNEGYLRSLLKDDTNNKNR